MAAKRVQRSCQNGLKSQYNCGETRREMRIELATPATPVVGTISGTTLMEAGSHRYGLLVILGAYALCYAAIRATGD